MQPWPCVGALSCSSPGRVRLPLDESCTRCEISRETTERGAGTDHVRGFHEAARAPLLTGCRCRPTRRCPAPLSGHLTARTFRRYNITADLDLDDAADKLDAGSSGARESGLQSTQDCWIQEIDGDGVWEWNPGGTPDLENWSGRPDSNRRPPAPKWQPPRVADLL